MGVPPESRNNASAVVDPDGAGPRLFFQGVPEGKQAKNRVHVDVGAAPGLTGGARMAALAPQLTGRLCARHILPQTLPITGARGPSGSCPSRDGWQAKAQVAALRGRSFSGSW
jgi:hypothetical protein